jgi:hypothetical protein
LQSRGQPITRTIDIAGLVDAGLLDLDAVFDRADWRDIDSIDTYTSCVFGAEGDEPGEVEITLQRSEAYGIEAFRWFERDGMEHGDITLDRDEAIEAGEEYASENDEEPDADELFRQIVETGYFGSADAGDIRAICQEATEHSQGYLLLPAPAPRPHVRRDASAHSAHQWVIQKGREHEACCRIELHVLQLCPHPPDAPRHPCNGAGYRGSRLGG